MCKSVGIHNDENVVHSGSETNIGLVNLHSENVYHGMKIISVLIGLLLVTIIIIKCNPILKKIYKKCFKKEKAVKELYEEEMMYYPYFQDRRYIPQAPQRQLKVSAPFSERCILKVPTPKLDLNCKTYETVV